MSRPARHHHRHAYADYLAHEEGSQTKHEFLDGDIYAIAGGTPEHAALSAAISSILAYQLGAGPCRIFSSDLRVRVLATGLATYPDVTVVCGDLARDPDSRVTVTNPTLVVEVTSDGTAEWDRTEKIEHYQKIPELRECVIVSHTRPLIELWRRGSDGAWIHEQAAAGESLDIDSLDCRLDVDEVYQRAAVQFP
jgi:Uma2 family endonuclease